MDRAAKTKKYRKKTRRKQNGHNRFRYLGLLAGLLLIAAASVLFLSKNKEASEEYQFVTADEWQAMLSVFGDDMVFNGPGLDSAYVTGVMVKETLRNMGLSSEIQVTQDKERLRRNEVTGYYERILDYLDIGRKVKCEPLLYLKMKKNQYQMLQGTYQCNFKLPKLESLQAYEFYLQDDVLLGLKASSTDSFELNEVLIKKIEKKKKQIIFTYNSNTYKAKSKQLAQFQDGMECTLILKNGEVQKAKKIILHDIAKKNNDQINVLLLNENKIYRESVHLICNCDFHTTNGEKLKRYKKKEELSTGKIKLQRGSHITVSSKQKNALFYISDGAGNPISNGYYGSMIIYRNENGYYIVNKVNIERYLYSVVASEMPSSFDIEALKAQAVCARSYVYRQMESTEYKDYHAQVDDSTNYQVYNRSEAVEADRQAVDATAGELMYYGDEIVTAYYFSTSCGYTSGMEIWNQEGELAYLKPKSLLIEDSSKFDLSDEKKFSEYIVQPEESAYDAQSPYFRWEATVNPNDSLSGMEWAIEQRRALNPGNIQYFNANGNSAASMDGFGLVTGIQCKKRSKSGAVLELTLIFENGNVKISSEYNIRNILGNCIKQIVYADGKQGNGAVLLPSAYFTISYDARSGSYILHGGGNGHGMGMSQYAADGMGRSGWDYKKILQYFYDGIEIHQKE